MKSGQLVRLFDPDRPKAHFEELPPRKYPKALRPLYIVNDLGGTMPWDNWLAKVTPDSPAKIEAIVFEDGIAVDAKGIIGDVGTGKTRASVFRGRDYRY